MRVTKAASIIIMWALMSVGCGTQKNQTEVPNLKSKPAVEKNGAGSVQKTKTSTEDDAEKEGFELTVGTPQTQGVSTRPKTLNAGHVKGKNTIRPLSAKNAARLLERVNPLKAETDDRKAFSLRNGSLPPPQTGQTILNTFPPKPEPSQPKTESKNPLKIIRFNPEGKVKIAPKISITFSQPMVPLTAHGELADIKHPITISPKMQGSWRWLGTQTLIFEVKPRLPQATKFTVTVPAGLKALSGAALPQSRTFHFETPPPTVTDFGPTFGPQRTDATLFLQFDQAVNFEEILKKISVRAQGRVYPIKVTKDLKDALGKPVKLDLSNVQQRRRFTFQTIEPLPIDTNVTVNLASQVPSLEGPLRTLAPTSYSFKTYGRFNYEGLECGYQGRCTRQSNVTLRFSNPVNEESVGAKAILVQPDVPNLQVYAHGNSLSITGRFTGNTTYQIGTEGLKDIFGQALKMPVSDQFHVGPSMPHVDLQGRNMLVLDPNSGGKYSVFSTNMDNLDIEIYRVEPRHWNDFRNFMQEASRNFSASPPGKKVFSGKVKTHSKSDELTETAIDLNAAFDHGFGHAILKVLRPPSRWNRPAEYVYKWIQSTQIGLEAIHDSESIVAWTTELTTGAPIEGCAVEFQPKKTATRVKTSKEGLASVPKPKSLKAPGILLATKGGDTAFIPEDMWWWKSHSNWSKKARKAQVRWHHYSDRHLYRPGEKVRVKGWIRAFGGAPNGTVSMLPRPMKTIRYEVVGPRDNKLKAGSIPVNRWGGFDMEFEIPKNANLGRAYVALKYGLNPSDWTGLTSREQFQIQEFRRPEFEVKARSSEGPHLIGTAAQISVNAQYFSGGPLSDVPVNWSIRAVKASFSPPNHSEFSFGTWTPWWRHSSRKELGDHHYQGKTDGAGEHHVQLQFKRIHPPSAVSVLSEATVVDLNRQRWTSATSLLVHPSQYYVGLKADRSVVSRGQDFKVKVVVADIDGQRIENRPVTVYAHRLIWTKEKGRWIQKPKESQECRVVSTSKPEECRFKAMEGGQYTVIAYVEDSKGRKNQSERSFWVPGGQQPPERQLKEERAMLIPDHKEYHHGQTAKILVNSPFFPAEGLATYARQGILKTQRFSLKDNSHILDIPIDEALAPGFTVRVDLAGSAPRLNASGVADQKLARRPAFASGEIKLNIPPRKNVLSVTALPQAPKLAPGTQTSVTVQVKDKDGQPVPNADVALHVVDESVLALSNYSFISPITSFFLALELGITPLDLRSFVMLVNPDEVKPPPSRLMRSRAKKMRDMRELATPSAAPMAESDELEEAPSDRGMSPNTQKGPMVSVRKNFDALAVFSARNQTDQHGEVSVRFKIPDNLTRYRVVAVAAHGENSFGIGESGITARLPLMVRPSPPRFLNYGDTFEFPVVLQNQTSEAMTVQLAMEVRNLELMQAKAVEVELEPNERREIRFKAKTQSAGTARYQIAAVAGDYSDAQRGQFPVWTPATTEAFATYGTIDEGVDVQGFKMPENVVQTFGKLEITTSSTAIQALTDAFLYLASYPYGCSEQLASQILAIVALKDVLSAFDTEKMPSPKALQASITQSIKILEKLQNADGGMPFWRRGHQTWPYITIHVAHALARAQKKNVDVPQKMVARFLKYLRNIEAKYPHFYSSSTKRHLSSYALYVRQLFGDRDIKRAEKLFDEVAIDKHSLEGLGWILSVTAGAQGSPRVTRRVLKYLNGRITETAAAAHFVSSVTDDAHLTLHSHRRTDGILLDALMTAQPKSDLIVKLVRGLLAHRKKGRWANTQENAFILLALDRYFRLYEKATPDFVAQIWLGQRSAGHQTFKGRSTVKNTIAIPMTFLSTLSGEQPITLQKTGPGRLYYRLGLQYAPQDLKLEASDHGFSVLRRYEAIDDPQDVRQDAQGAWVIKAGARVRVYIAMVAQSRRHHVALVDPLPAGLEAVNTSLAASATIIPESQPSKRGQAHKAWDWRGVWFEHQNMRDERVEAFTSSLWSGAHEYTYIAQATTPGRFVVPPARAEEMYHPETFGRSRTDVVIIRTDEDD